MLPHSSRRRRSILAVFVAVPLLLISAAAALLAGVPDAGRVLTADDLKNLSFRSIGPANMGGRVSAIALVPGSRREFYVGFATGGVFKTENLGVTFTPVFDKYPVLSIGAIAVADAPRDWAGWDDPKEKAVEAADPNTPRDKRGRGKIVWVGTGEGNGRNSSSWGGGVYRSTDAGATFEFLGLAETHDIPRLALDPRDPDVAYVAALGHLWGANPERGVFKTRDGGKTWQHVLKAGDKVGACDVVVDPQRPDTVYAALYARLRTAWSFSGNSEDGGIFRSDDAGKSWKKLTRGLPPRTGRIGLALSSKESDAVFATVESDFGGSGREPTDDRSISGGLFKSEDRGETWARLSPYNFRPFYFSRVAVDPEDARRVYLPGWDLGISDDGGRTFRRSGSENVHVDFHAIVVNPVDTNQIIVGNDGGIYVSHDRARTWDYLNHIAAGQFYRIAVDMSDPYRVAGGLQDNGSYIGPSGTLWQTEDESRDGILNDDWTSFYSSDGFGVAFDPAERNLLYATSQGGGLVRINLATMVRSMISESPREGQERLRFNWNAPFLISQHDPTVLYHAGNRVFRLTERGARWFAISGDLSRDEPGKTETVGSEAETYGTVVSLAESPLAKGLLWAGTDDGLVHVTQDDGGAWANVTPPAAGGLYVSRIAASRHARNTAYVAVDGHRSDVFKPLILMTTDLGKTWKEITGDLPAGGPVNVIIEDITNPDVLYCGTEFGLYVTLDRGARWVRMNGKSLPPAPVDDLVIHPRERDLVVGTHGRSIYILDDASMFAQLTAEARAKPLVLLGPLPGVPRLYNQRAYGSGHGLFRAKNRPMGAILNYWVRDERREEVSVAIADASGLVVRTLTGPGRAGMNRVVWDLQADPKHRFDGPEQANLGQSLFVPAGDYKVTITMGAEKSEGTVKVLPAPNAESR